MQNEDMTPAEWHNHDEYEADADLLGMFDEEDDWKYEGSSSDYEE